MAGKECWSWFFRVVDIGHAQTFFEVFPLKLENALDELFLLVLVHAVFQRGADVVDPAIEDFEGRAACYLSGGFESAKVR